MGLNEYLDFVWMLMVGVVMIIGLLLVTRDDDLDDEETSGQRRGRLGHSH
ncbi:MAG TPA: hypothetical protein VFC09_13315 [Candidatus Dormibacteraeota bacterium]|nr:hypothetical protein [Candidatus Dormibacteraeota bacterium]